MCDFMLLLWAHDFFIVSVSDKILLPPNGIVLKVFDFDGRTKYD